MTPLQCLLLLYILILAAGYVRSQTWQNPDDVAGSPSSSCTTPTNVAGTCVAIQKCTALRDLLDAKPISRETAEFLRQSTCGFDGTSPKVCCPHQQMATAPPTPPSTTTTTTTRTTTTTNSQFPPAVTTSAGYSDALSGHRNRVLFPSTNCGPYFQTDRAYDGNRTEIGQYPWMVLLGARVKRQQPANIRWLCGGSIINSKYILTAAHCTTSSLSITTVRVGEHTVSTDPDCENGQCAPPVTDIDVDEVSIPASYKPFNSQSNNDIAIIRLKTPLTFGDNPYVAPICLPFGEVGKSEEMTHSNYIVAGWGRTENELASDFLLHKSLRPLSFEQCSEFYRPSAVPVTQEQICSVGTVGSNSCSGNFGSPVMTPVLKEQRYEFYQAGIVAYGPRYCGNDGRPGVYIKVSSYLKWILDNVRP